MKRHFYKNEKFVFLLFVMLSLLALRPSQLMAQTLKTDGAIPALDACGASGTFTVSIARGAADCNTGKLQIALPATGFEYVAGSAKIGAVAVAETNVTTTGTTLTLPNITAGTITDLVNITYQVRANCQAIPLATLPDEQKPTVSYTFNGCVATEQVGQSEIININFAVLKVEVNPNASQGVIGSLVTRTIKVTNTGNGAINTFSIQRTLGASLAVTSVTQPTGWTVDATNPNLYVYTGATLAPGTSINLTETVQINACAAMQTTFDAYYGCAEMCTLGNANGTITAGISINQATQPKLDVTVITTPTINCYNQEYEYVWKITNNGTAYSSATKLDVTNDGSSQHATGYFNVNSVTLDGTAVAIDPTDSELIPSSATSIAFGTTGKVRKFSINIPDLAPGESREIRFKEYYAASLTDCSKNVNNLYRPYIAYKGTYKNRDACSASGVNPDILIPFAQTNSSAFYGFSGINIGEVDIVTGYNADFSINNWHTPSTDIHAGAYFDIILELSASIRSGFNMTNIKLIDPLTNDQFTPIITDQGNGKYRLRINYGGPNWGLNTMFNTGSYHLQFPVTLDCSAGTEASYTVMGQLNIGGGCTDLIQFECQTVSLNAHCGIGCGDGGLDNNYAILKRMTYGQISPVPDDATPDLLAPAVDPNNPPANFATRYFIAGDKLEISQSGKVLNGTATPAGGWIEGTFSIASPADLGSIAVPNTGKVTITRGANVYSVTGLAINTSIPNNFSIDLGIANLMLAQNNLPIPFTYLDGDVIVSSLQIQPMITNISTGVKEFPTTYNVKKGTVAYACNSNFKATGYYGPTWLQFFTSAVSTINSCDQAVANINSMPNFNFLFREVEYWRNNLFPNEFRQVARPTKAIFTVPAGLQMIGVNVKVNNNSLTNLSKTINFPAPVTNGSYTLDIKQVIIDLKGGDYLDEGWEVTVTPMAQPTCKSTGEIEDIQVEGFMEGTFWHRFPDYHEVHFINSPEVSIGQISHSYKTDNNLLSATVTQQNSTATTNQAKWVIQVNNSSSFRRFSNVWMGQSAGTTGVSIASVQQVTDLNGNTPVGAASTSVNGVFQLGDFATGATGSKYYLVAADYSSCDPGNISLVYGADCNGYPTSVATATCSTALPVTLNYTPVFANLQTSIVNQIAGTARPKLCEQIPYEIQVNNAGLGDATTLTVSVPLPSAGGINYVPGTFQLTNAFTSTAGTYSAIADVNVSTSASAIVFTIPIANVPALKNGEKFLLKFDLTTAGCTFKSGQRISFRANGKNGCGSDIAITNAASSNRVTIDGSPTAFPELSITLSSAAMNLTTAGTDLSATYNFTLKNVGDGINNFPATTAYSFNVKLPTGWVFAGNPQDLVPVAQATYVGLDPVKGYLFNLAQDLIVGNEIKIVNATMVYANASALTCDTDFGPIYESAYTTFSPVSLCTGTPCQIDQLSVENESTILIVSQPTPPAGEATQAFCAANTPTLASLVLTNAGILIWYDSATSTAALDNTTALANGQTYYVANKLVDGSVCESTRFAVTAVVDAVPTATAGADQTVYTVGEFIMAGNNPVAPMTGVWTELIPTGETAQATIANPTSYNTNVQVVAGKTVTLRWTVTNGTCSTFDDVVLSYIVENDLKVEKTADKPTVEVGEDLTYTITITNSGPGSLVAGAVIGLIETLPTALTNLVYTPTGGVYDVAANTFILAADMPAGQFVTLLIKGTVAADFAGNNMVNKVAITTPTGIIDTDPSNNEAEVTTPVTRNTDLAVVKIANKPSVTAGDALQYTITITNNGTATLLANEAIKVTETLPVGFNNLTYASTGGTYSATAGTFTLAAAMPTGQSVSFTINGTVAANYSSGTIDNTVVIAPPTGVIDLILPNNTATVSTPVVRIADLGIVKTANKTSVVAGETLVYTLTITNNGPSTLFANENIQVIETLPAGFTGATFASTNGTYTNGSFKLGADLATGASVAITVSGTVSSAATAGSILTNLVSITTPSEVTDPVPSNNTDDELTPVTRVADLSVVKTASSMAPVVGTNFTFTIKAKNNGPSDASAVIVNDLLPTGYVYVSANASTGSYAGSTGIWTIGNLTNGAEATLTITVKVQPTGIYANTATVTATETDPNLTNNTSTVTPIPLPSPPVAVDDVTTTKANNSVVIPILANDHPGLSESPLVPSSVEVMSNPLHGTVKVNADGTVTYTPNHGYVGTDNFTYRVQDALGYWSNVATVTITIVANDLHIPNVFTPNGDGKNDTFEIVGIEGYSRASITIFNRWGNEVYRNTAYQNNWDGYGLNEGTYYYKITLTTKDGKDENYKGWVLLKH